MTKRTLTVTHNGQTFTRTTARTYSHVVLFQRDIEAARAALVPTSGWLKQWKRDHAFYVEEAARGRQQYQSEADFAKYQAKAAMTPEEYVAQRVSDWHKAFNASVAAGNYDRQFAGSWCGRPDLAKKEADNCRKMGHINVEIVAVPQ